MEDPSESSGGSEFGDGPLDSKSAHELAALMLSIGASYSEVETALKYRSCPHPPHEVIATVMSRWSEEDKKVSDYRRAVQRRRLTRQVRVAMDHGRVGDAVRYR